MRIPDLSRRRFLALTGAGAAGLMIDPARLLAVSDFTLDAKSAFAGMARLGDGIWAVASTPLESSDWTTGSNGGLIAGTDRVVAVEGFLQPQGASWVSDQALELAGRRPTDVVVTHFHGDHVNGLSGYAASGEAPRIWMTEATQHLIRHTDEERGSDDSVRTQMVESAKILDAKKPTTLDLGGKAISIHPRRGHTSSDVSVEIDEPSIVFFGDLLWNGFFPNYVNTIPSPFAASVRAGRRDRDTVYVPGHGALADGEAVDRMLELIDAVEEVARLSFEKGVSPEEAAKGFAMPASVEGWVMFNPSYPERAIGAWHKELGGS